MQEWERRYGTGRREARETGSGSLQDRERCIANLVPYNNGQGKQTDFLVVYRLGNTLALGEGRNPPKWYF